MSCGGLKLRGLKLSPLIEGDSRWFGFKVIGDDAEVDPYEDAHPEMTFSYALDEPPVVTLQRQMLYQPDDYPINFFLPPEGPLALEPGSYLVAVSLPIYRLGTLVERVTPFRGNIRVTQREP